MIKDGVLVPAHPVSPRQRAVKWLLLLLLILQKEVIRKQTTAVLSLPRPFCLENILAGVGFEWNCQDWSMQYMAAFIIIW